MINTVYGDQDVEWGAVQEGWHGQGQSRGGDARREGNPRLDSLPPSPPMGHADIAQYVPSPEVRMAAGRSARRETRRIVRNVRVRTNEERRAARQAEMDAIAARMQETTKDGANGTTAAAEVPAAEEPVAPGVEEGKPPLPPMDPPLQQHRHRRNRE